MEIVGVPQTLVGSPFNMLGAPFGLEYFTDGYQGLPTSGAGFVLILVRGASGNSLPAY